ncbi:hypothetical protein HDU98_010521 [Podochytrium sp. JEL0797]|nr:hypothetical protein HDU98_010521 [Podochytrium sp. JEL0797]
MMECVIKSSAVTAVMSGMEGVRVKHEHLARKAVQDSEREVKIRAMNDEVEVLKEQVEALRVVADELQAKEEDVKSLYAVAKESEQASSVVETVASSEGETATAVATPVVAPDSPELIAAREAHNSARAEFNALKRTLDTQTSSLATLRARHDLDLGFDGGMVVLVDQCLELDTPEYVYKLCFFDRAVQKSKGSHGETSLGTWGGWIGQDLTPYSGKNLKYFEAEFTNGLQCWNGPQRSVKVSVECGPRNEVLSIVEPSKCEYLARVMTPGVCESEEEVERHHLKVGEGHHGGAEGKEGAGAHGGHWHDEL